MRLAFRLCSMQASLAASSAHVLGAPRGLSLMVDAESAGGFLTSDESADTDLAGGGFEASDDEPFGDSPAPRSRSRSPAPSASPEESSAPLPPRHIEFELDPPVIHSMGSWQVPLLSFLRPLRHGMMLFFWLLRPMTHDAFLCGNLTEHYGFEVSILHFPILYTGGVLSSHAPPSPLPKHTHILLAILPHPHSSH